MRRYITVIVLMLGLLLAAIVLPAQDINEGFFVRRLKGTDVLCVSRTPTSEHISCVYVPRDGVQVNLPHPGPATT